MSHVIIAPATKRDIETILTDASLAGGATTTMAECIALSLVGCNRLALTVRCTYHASSTSGITVYIYTSTDNSVWDTDELTSFEPSFTANTTVQKTVFIDPDAKYMKVRITNKQADQVVTTITVKATVVR